jgi:dTMP kinase
MAAGTQKILKRFIVLEGGDGTGTTTQLKRLRLALERAGIAHWITAEPSDRSEGLLIRRILSGELPRDPGTLARLFAADRNEHLNGKDGILERLDRGEAVICDRYVLSSLAYQGVACGRELPAELNRGFPLPELLIYFDLAPETSLERLAGRENLDIFEKLPFQEKVRAAYQSELARYASSGMRIATLDASRSVEDVGRDMLSAVGDALDLALSAPPDADDTR